MDPNRSSTASGSECEPSLEVAIAEPMALYRQGLTSLLRTLSTVRAVHAFQSAREAAEHCEAHCPDVLILDLEMPFAEGLGLIEQVSSLCCGTRLIGMHHREHPKLVATALHLGVDSLLCRTATFEDLKSSIASPRGNRSEAAGTKSGSPPHCVFVTELTPREREVALRLVEGRTPAEIARDLHVSVKTVDTHRRHTLKKLDARNVADLTRLAIADGVSQLTDVGRV